MSYDFSVDQLRSLATMDVTSCPLEMGAEDDLLYALETAACESRLRVEDDGRADLVLLAARLKRQARRMSWVIRIREGVR